MATEPITGQTYQEAGSLQTDALQNAQLDYFAAWLNCVVLSVGDTAPPGSPTNGDRYIVGASATGEWATHDDALAVYRDGWQFYAPTEGVWVKDLDSGDDYEFVGSGPDWQVKSGGGTGAATVVTEAGSSRDMAPSDAGDYIRYTGTGAKTCTFDDADGFSADEEYHIANRAASGNLTLTEAGTMTLNPPKGGTLVLEPGDTVTVKMIASDEADVFGSTEPA